MSMNMNDMLNDFSCDYPNAMIMPGTNMNSVSGCGFGSWIWILLILFYTNNQNTRSNNGCGCPNARSNDGCGCGNTGCTSGAGGYLFLLVILFLCGGCGCNNQQQGMLPYGPFDDLGSSSTYSSVY